MSTAIAMPDGGLPEDRRRRLTELSQDERAQISHDAFYSWAKGRGTFASLSRKHNVTPYAIKKLIEGYAAFVRTEHPDAKAGSIEAYRWLQGKTAEIIDRLEDPSIAVLVKAKAIEGFIQATTRLDKIHGTEAPTGVVVGDASGESLSQVVQRMFGGANPDTVSPMDDAAVGKEMDDDIEDAEIVEE